MRDLDAGAPGHTTTNWQSHDTLSMWRMLEPQQTDSHWRHVSGLRRMAELTAAHVGRLKQYRDNLAQAWPPERSKASQAFIARLDYLIEHVGKTHEVAAANYTTVSTATAAMQAARGDVEKLHAEYMTKLQALKDHENLIQAERASQLPGTSIGPPPVTEADLEGVNMRARKVMSELSTTLVLAHSRLQRPAPYVHRTTIEQPPRILPVVTAPPRISAESVPSGRRPVRQMDALEPQGSRLTGQFQTGGSDISPSLARLPARSWSGDEIPPKRSDPGLNHSRRVEKGGHLINGAAAPSTGAHSFAGTMSSKFGSVVSGNGIIESPAITQVGDERVRQGVNPAGGVIGGHRESSNLIGHPGVGQPPPPRSRDPMRRREPDNPWQVREGVPAIVVPPSPPTSFDPGPAIGISR
jgi:hypothetical protein